MEWMCEDGLEWGQERICEDGLEWGEEEQTSPECELEYNG